MKMASLVCLEDSKKKLKFRKDNVSLASQIIRSADIS